MPTTALFLGTGDAYRKKGAPIDAHRLVLRIAQHHLKNPPPIARKRPVVYLAVPAVSANPDLLRDAIDLHCHSDLELDATHFREREPEWSWLPRAEALGVRGVVLKSHWWPTAYVVPYIKELYRGPVELWSSITLNAVCGGPELWAVEAAARLGAKVVFLPTWSARNDLTMGGFSTRVREAFPTLRTTAQSGYEFIGTEGHLTATARELLAYCRDRGLTLATGHVSWRESLAFAQAADAIGFARLVFSHPLSRSVRAPADAVRRAAELGAWIELTGTNVLPGRMSAEDAVAWCRAAGLERVVISSDHFRPELPPPPEYFAELLSRLHAAGLREDEVRLAVVENPRRVLGID